MSSTERLFFALWPDQQVRQALSESCSGLSSLVGQGKLVNPLNLHITLHFLGNIPVGKIDCFIRQAQSVKADCFQLSINQCGFFKKPKICWLGPAETPAALNLLHKQLGKQIQHCGFQPEHRPYRPHVTMVRKIKQAIKPELNDVIHWQVNRFVLVESISWSGSVEYRIKSSFPLIEKPQTGI